jgi:hypothetical protein
MYKENAISKDGLFVDLHTMAYGKLFCSIECQGVQFTGQINASRRGTTAFKGRNQDTCV